MEYTEQRRPRRRRRGLLITVLVLLVLLVVGLTVADRVGASYAERQIADRVASQIAAQGASSSRPEVQVHGVPFLTQVVGGTYDKITILVRDLEGRQGDQAVRLPRVDITALTVRAPLDTVVNRKGRIVAETVTGAATVDYASVVKLTGREGIKLAEKDGKLTVSAPLEALGRTFTVSGTANLEVQDGAVRVRFQDLTAPELAAVPLARNLLNSYAQQISFDLRLPRMPLNLAVQKITPTPQGLQVHATATDVPLNSGGF